MSVLRGKTSIDHIEHIKLFHITPVIMEKMVFLMNNIVQYCNLSYTEVEYKVSFMSFADNNFLHIEEVKYIVYESDCHMVYDSHDTKLALLYDLYNKILHDQIVTKDNMKHMNEVFKALV